jgi:hypothetical protein
VVILRQELADVVREQNLAAARQAATTPRPAWLRPATAG